MWTCILGRREHLLLYYSIQRSSNHNYIVNKCIIHIFLQFHLTCLPNFILSCIRQESPKKDGIFSKLVQRFPYIFNMWRPLSQLDISQENSSLDSQFSPQGMKPEKYENPNVGSINGSVEGFHNWSSELQSILSNATDTKTSLRFVCFMLVKHLIISSSKFVINSLILSF